MASTEREPLLEREREDEVATTTSEDAPLLVDEQDEHSETDEHDGSPRRRSKWSLWSSSRSRRTEGDDKDGSRRCRWPSIVAMVILVLLAIAALLVGFLVPGAVKTYAENAAVIEPTALSVESITADGIQARIQANFRLDGSKVDDTNARRIGRLATGIMRKLETEETRVDVYLPTYDNALLGSAVIPPITIDIVDGHTTTIDIVTDLSPGAPESIRSVANDWLEGRLGQLRVTGATDLKIKSGLIPLGTHNVRESLVFEGNDVPSMPEYNIDSINFHDIPLGGRHGQKAVGANVTITAHNDYPVSFEVPPLGFAVLVPNCDASLPYIPVAEAVTEMIHVQGKSDVSAIGLGVVREIPDTLVKTCPRSDSSPLDHFMEHYLHGEDARIFVRGRKIPDSDTPEWISDILESITVPLEFPGQSFGNRIREFSLTEVDFKLPSPFADPGDPDAVPRVSGTIGVLAVLPDQLSNMDVGVNSIRSTADLIYEGDKLGELNLNEWQPANSTKFKDEGDTLLNVTSRVVDVPLTITNGSVFSDVISRMFFGGEDIFLGVQAAVDAKVGTVLGDLALKGVPANGTIPVKGSFCLQDVELTSRKGIPTDILGNIAPRIEDLRILNTSETGVSMQAKINFTNPTQYTATIPFLNVHILGDDVIIGEATAQGIHLELGNNTGNIVHATWDPARFGGKKAQEAAQSLLSGYLSGKNTTLGVRTHRGSVPTMPLLGEALSNLNITVPTPRLGLPGDGDSGGDGDGDGPAQRFIRDATFHVFSSSATFTLASPLHHDLIYIEAINATAYYNHTEPVGQIVTHDPFPAPPGLSQTPRLPVRWSADKIGYDKLRAALGGGLKLDAVADVTVRIGKWVETIHYTGKGIGAKVRI